ncbi:MAG: transglycosylase SLT domain-containing protein [Longimicrobiales bacterium]
MTKSKLVLGVFLAVGAVACVGGGDADVGAEAGAGAPTEATPAVTQGDVGPGSEGPDELARVQSAALRDLNLDRSLTGDLNAMVERRYIRALVAYSKTHYFLDGPQQKGLTYEALRTFEDELNEELETGNLQVHVAILPVPRDRLLDALEEGLGDIAAANLTVTDERRRRVDFSDPLMTQVREVVVTGPASGSLQAIEDLAGERIYVRRSSSYYESLQALNRTFEAQGREPVVVELAEEHLEDEDLLEMTDAGLIEATVVDEYKADLWAQVFPDLRVHEDMAVREQGSVAWAFRKDSPELAAAINRFVERNRRGTLLGNIVLNRYLKDATYVERATDGVDFDRFEQTFAHFRTYAPQYGFDPVMMVAQGYQESRLDQSLESHRGAVGIMQLLPSTAADPAVGIPDISSAEDNIHAGIKYMAWIRDNYFPDDGPERLDRALFAFASYNAGPNRIRRLRAAAAERGLDPDKWFKNVEVIAAEDIGRETVQYVSNIYKYYAAYRLVLERQAMEAEG